MAVVGKGQVFQFDLTSTGQLLPTIANCYTKTKAAGVKAAGDFTIPIARPPVAAAVPKNDAPIKAGTQPAPAVTATNPPSKSTKLAEMSGTGFIVSASGHVLTNNHVVGECVGEITGTLTTGGSMKLRVLSTDGINDLALLQAPTSTKEAATIRATAVHSGDSVIAIGYPFHGLLSSDFTVTTGIVSSLSGILNDTRYLQISAPVQPGNSGRAPLRFNWSRHRRGVRKDRYLEDSKADWRLP
jgi:S1-C subfamily serine protease